MALVPLLCPLQLWGSVFWRSWPRVIRGGVHLSEFTERCDEAVGTPPRMTRGHDRQNTLPGETRGQD